MGRIRRLSDELINQIAAGEVVERPASVVKELAENAIDAGATQVRVLLSEGGMAAIAVIDDGVGMSREDALLSLERHATSKLVDAAGLFDVHTKGFRGEAIPSIASVSRFTMLTSEHGAEVGTRIAVEGGSVPEVEDAPPVDGTRIDVVDLFFNVPARRKFLKRESTELVHCEEAVVRLALAHPEVGFTLEHGGKQLLSSPASERDPKERIGAMLGAEVTPHLLAIDERRLGVEVHGFIASPEFTLPTARALYTFVNRRYIRDRGVNAAVQRAFQEALPPGRQPVAVIFIDVDPPSVDVNVHPQKLEVRFSDPRSVQEAITAAIARALKAAPWRQSPSQPLEGNLHAHYALAVDRFLARAQEAPGLPLEPQATPAVADQRPAFGTARPGINEAPPPGYFGSLAFLSELGARAGRGRFWLCEGAGGTLVILDPRAVRERVLFQSLAERHEAGRLASAAPTLFSATVTLPAADAAALAGQRDVLEELGLELEPFGGDTLAVKRIPPELEACDVTALLGELAALVTTDHEPADVLRLMAHHGASGPDRTVSHDEVHRLLVELDGADFSVPVLRQRVVLQEVPLLELEARTGE